MERIENGEIDPSFLITHRIGLEQGPEAYKTFRDKKDGCIKVVINPHSSPRLASSRRAFEAAADQQLQWRRVAWMPFGPETLPKPVFAETPDRAYGHLLAE